jgi:hypothetical protein
MTTGVKHVVKVNMCKVKVTKDDKKRFCQEHISYTHGGVLMNFIEMFTIVRKCVAHMNQISRSKVKVTLRGL